MEGKNFSSSNWIVPTLAKKTVHHVFALKLLGYICRRWHLCFCSYQVFFIWALKGPFPQSLKWCVREKCVHWSVQKGHPDTQRLQNNARSSVLFLFQSWCFFFYLSFYNPLSSFCCLSFFLSPCLSLYLSFPLSHSLSLYFLLFFSLYKY